MYVDFGDRKKTWGEELKTWYYSFKNYSFVFTGNYYDFSILYHPHAWSIPVEFRGSIVIYTALLALARCTRKSAARNG